MEKENIVNDSTFQSEKQWFIATANSTHEKKVADNLRKRIETANFQDSIFRVLVPEEEVQTTDSKGNTVIKLKPIYKGYIFVEMYMTEEAWYLVRNTPGVTGFVGSSGKGTKPFPVTREEMESILKRAGQIDDSMYDRYAIGDLVKVIHGPFEGQEGTILSINRENGEVSVSTYFFGRASQIDVEFSEIEKI